MEYTLLLAFLALASAGLFMTAGDSAADSWDGAQTSLDGAAAAASPTSSAVAPPATGGDGGGHHHRHGGDHGHD